MRKKINSVQKGVYYQNKYLKTQHAFEVFPEEIWEQIFQRVGHSQSVYNVLLANKELSTSFQASKPLWLCEQVMPLLLPQFSESGNNILACRLVCKDWSIAVDKTLQSHTLLRPRSYREIKQRVRYLRSAKGRLTTVIKGAPCVILTESEQVSKFHNELNLCSGSNFVCRSVNLLRQPPPDETDEEKIIAQTNAMEFFNAVLNLLTAHGSKIQDINLDFGSFFPTTNASACEILKKIFACFEQIPNVVSIGIGFEIDDTFVPSFDMSKSIMKYKQCFKFAALKNLNVFAGTALFGKDFYRFLRMFCRKNNIIRLGFPLELWRSEHTGYLHNLREIFIDAFLVRNKKRVTEFLKHLKCLTVKTLRVLPSCQSKLDIFDVLKAIQNSSITTLEIMNPYDNVMVSLSLLSTIEPIHNVNVLTLHDGRNIRFEFLTLLPFLKELRVFTNEDIVEQRNKIYETGLTADISKYLSRKRRSELLNVQKVLPCLSVFEVFKTSEL